MSAVDPAAMRRLNSSLTLRSLYENPSLTMAQLVERTNLSRRTTELILAELIADNENRDGLGRPSSRIDSRPAPARHNGAGDPRALQPQRILECAGALRGCRLPITSHCRGAGLRLTIPLTHPS